jgi:hypothetical protein
MEGFVPAEKFISVGTPKLQIFNSAETVNLELMGRLTQKYYASNAITDETEYADFVIEPSQSMFMDLSSLTITVKGRFVNLDGSVIEGTSENDVMIPKAYLKHALFRYMEIELNGVQILPTNVNWVVIDSLWHAVSAGYDLLESGEALDRCYFEPEKSEALVELPVQTKEIAAAGTTPAKTLHYVSTEAGPVRKHAFEDISGSKTLLIKGYLLPGVIREQLLYIPSKVRLRVRLSRAAPENYVLAKVADASGKARHRFQITSMYLEQDSLVLSKNSLNAMEQLFAVKPAELPFPNIEMHQILIPQGSVEFRQSRLFQGLLPEQIWGVLIPTQALLGHAKMDPACFGNYNITKLKLVLDEDLVFSHQLTINAKFPANANDSNEGAEEAFFKLCREIAGTPAAKFLTPNKFLRNSTIFLFRLTPERHSQFGFAQQAGTINIEGEFGIPGGATHNLTLLLISVRKQKLQFTGPNRLVSVVS